MKLLEAVRRANRPGPPEDSITLRVACAGAVIVGIGACRAEGELSAVVTACSVALVAAGMTLSYRTRAKPLPWIKPVLAVAAMLAFAWFFRQITGQGLYDVTTVEDPLAVLFVWVQVAHAFDVPARRDLAFSLAGSASLMAVAAAQAVDMTFGLYVLAWTTFGIVGLLAMWSSASEGGRLGARGVGGALVAVAVTGAAVLIVLPAPHVAGRVDFPAAAGAGGELPVPGALAGDGKISQLAKPGSPDGATRVGGFLGFSDHLDTALRGQLADTVIMRVRAQQPSFWLGETFDDWDGASWIAKSTHSQRIQSASPFILPTPPSSPTAGPPETDLQTFYVTQSSPNLVFHAGTAHAVWFPSDSLFTSSDGTIVSPIALGPGAIYTVQSYVENPTPAALRSAPVPSAASRGPLAPYLELPRAYPQAQALAATVSARAPDTYDKVQSLIAWIGAHTRYSTDIPPLRPGQDTVDEFLFGNRTGFCEQISTSLAVMLRSIGIPAREAVGYVPGPYNPITDLYEVEENDAHAWVQVWFPGYGWQNFDPTAVVPLANPSPGSTLLHEVAHALAPVPWVPVGVVVVLGAAAMVTVRRWRRRPRAWAERAAHLLERAGRRAGRPRQPGETITEYAAALDARLGDRSGSWGALAAVVEAHAYGGRPLEQAEGERILDSMRAMGGPVRRARRGGPGPGQPESASASPREAPASSRGR